MVCAYFGVNYRTYYGIIPVPPLVCAYLYNTYSNYSSGLAPPCGTTVLLVSFYLYVYVYVYWCVVVVLY